MKRYVVRNYGASRQLSVGGQQVCVVNDGIVETDDVMEAQALAGFEHMTMTDRGSELASPPSPGVQEKQPEGKQKNSVDEPEDESYEDMNSDELQAIAKDREIETSGLDDAEIIKALVAYDDEPEKSEKPAEKETPLKIGDKVSAVFEDDPYEGIIKSINKKKRTAKIDFEDDTTEIVGLGKLTRVA